MAVVYEIVDDDGGPFEMVGNQLRLTDTPAPGLYLVTVRAYDPAKGWSTTQTVTVTVNATGSLPANSVVPTISDTTPTLGDVLTASAGTWSGNPLPSYAYQWARGGIPITGATSATYTVQSADIGSALTVIVTATNGSGSASAISVATSTVQDTPAAPVNTSLPTIVDTTPLVGDIITTSSYTTGTWTGSPAPTLSAVVSVGDSGVTLPYTIVDLDIGKEITVTVTATNASGSAQATSAETDAIAASEDPGEGSVGINDLTLAMSVSPSTVAEGETATWYLTRAGYTLLSSESITFILTPSGGTTADFPLNFDNTMAAIVADYDALYPGWGSFDPADNSVTLTGLAPNPFPIPRTPVEDFSTEGSEIFTLTVSDLDHGTITTAAASVTVTDGSVGDAAQISFISIDEINPVVGDLLTASVTATGTPAPTVTYQWQADTAGNGTFANIGGATNSTYTVLAADSGDRIRVLATATNAGGTATAQSTTNRVAQAPTISNVVINDTTPTVGQTLSVAITLSAGYPTPTYAYAWKADGSTVGTSATYTVQSSDEAKFITCTVIGTNSQGSSSYTSAGTSAVEAAATDPVSDQIIEFGALTRSGHGGIKPTGLGEITSASITGGNNGDWQIASNGTITPTTDNPVGTTLTILFNGSASRTIAIQTTGTAVNGVDLSTAYSVASTSESNTVLGLGVATLAGKTVLLRPSPTRYTLLASALASKTYASTLTIRGHYNRSSDYLWNQSGDTVDVQGPLTLSAVHRLALVDMEIFLSGGTSEASGIIVCHSGSTNLLIYRNLITGEARNPQGEYGTGSVVSSVPPFFNNPGVGVVFNTSGTNTSCNLVTIRENVVQWVMRGVRLLKGCDNLTTERNAFRYILCDGRQYGRADNIHDIDNFVYDNIESPDDVHFDALQCNVSETVADDWVGLEITGNVHAKTEGGSGHLGQGIFLGGASNGTGKYRDAIVHGNLILTTVTNGMLLGAGGDGHNCKWNTIAAPGTENTNNTDLRVNGVNQVEQYNICDNGAGSLGVTTGTNGSLIDYQDVYVGMSDSDTFAPGVYANTYADIVRRYATRPFGPGDRDGDGVIGETDAGVSGLILAYPPTIPWPTGTTRRGEEDLIPDQFTFTDVTGAPVSTVFVSNEIIVSGITAAAPITISGSGAQYSINSGTYTSAAGTVVSGDAVKVRVTSSASNSTAVTATLSIGGISDTYSVTTQAGAADTTPDAFAFTDVTGATLSTVYTSNTITVAGITAATSISISGTGAQYSKNSGAYTSAAGTVVNGDTVAVRTTSSGSYSAAVTATLTIGGVSDTYSVTTAADTTPATITSPDTASVAENATLAHALTASESGTWTIRTSAQDAASVDYTHFEISGSTLRWASNGTKDYETPGDTGANNSYSVVVRHTDGAGNTADQTITVSVTDVSDGAQPAPVATAISGILTQANSNTGTLTTTASASAGKPIVVLVNLRGRTEWDLSVSDSVGNTYTRIIQAEHTGTTNVEANIWWCQNPAATLPSGGTITFTVNQNGGGTGTANGITACAFKLDVDAQLVTDAEESAASASGASSGSVTTGASLPNGALVFGLLAHGADTTNNWTQPAGWTEVMDSKSSSRRVNVAGYIATSSAGTVTYNPTQDGTAVNAAWAAAIAAFVAL